MNCEREKLTNRKPTAIEAVAAAVVIIVTVAVAEATAGILNAAGKIGGAVIVAALTGGGEDNKRE